MIDIPLYLDNGWSIWIAVWSMNNHLVKTRSFLSFKSKICDKKYSDKGYLRQGESTSNGGKTPHWSS